MCFFTPSRTKRALTALFLAITLSTHAAERVVDFRYGIPTWNQPLGIPEDWHKPMGNEHGALLYDFGPGPYAKQLTTVEVSATGDAFTLARQTWADHSRIPVMRTELTRGATDRITLTTLSLPPSAPSASNGATPRYERLNGIVGSLGWAQPADNVGPEFRNTAWGVNRPVHYRIKVEAGASKQIMLGFCESYKLMLRQRLADMRVEGAPAQLVDLALNAAPNEPQVFLFDAKDLDQDGWLDIKVFSVDGADPNVALNTIAMFAPQVRLLRAELIAGSLAEKDQAELRIACGHELIRQEARSDLIHAAFSPGVEPVVTIKTNRVLQAGPDHALLSEGMPFVVSTPRATKVERTRDGWQLHFAPDTREVSAWVFSGHVTAKDVAAATRLSVDDALALTNQRWTALNAKLPYHTIAVADPAIQALIDACIRTLYQSREIVDGKSEFHSSFTLYRGLWAGEASYLGNTISALGDHASARANYEVVLSWQHESGLIYELPPAHIHRTASMAIWGLGREIHRSGDWDYARAKWPQIMRAVRGLRGLRDQTLADPSQPYHGMFPPGFNDGGILELSAEYSTVHWTLIALTESARVGDAIDQRADVAEIRRFASDLLGSFDQARARDQRRDPHGNLYLPVRVAMKGPDPYPPLAQWGIMEVATWSDHLALNDPLLVGSIAMLEAHEKQGLPASTGWVPDGIWAGMGSLYGHWMLLLNRPEKVSDVLYSVANHAAPLGTWVEEQSVIGAPLRLAGDQPHNFATSIFIHLAGSMLAFDHSDTLHLLGAVPAEWLKSGAVNQLNNYRTGKGGVTLALTVSADGKTATLDLAPITPTGKLDQIILHLQSLHDAGFDSDPTTKTIIIQPGQHFTQTFTRR
jgi:hypothetical protein